MANRQAWESARELAMQDSNSVARLPADDIKPKDIHATSSTHASRRRRSYLPAPKPITRFRITKSCLICRRRKVKCDTVRPTCGTCEKTKSECVYNSSSLTDFSQSPHHSGDNSHGIKRQRELNDPVIIESSSVEVQTPYHILREIQRGQAALREQFSDSQAIASRLDQLTAIVEKWTRTNGPQSLEKLNTAGQRLIHDTPIDAEFQQRGATDYLKLADISSPAGQSSKARQFQTGHTENNTGDDFPIPSGLETDLVDPVGSLNLGHLSLEEGGKSRYVGTTYWAYISREITELNRLLRGQTLSNDRSASPSDDYSSLDEDEFQDLTPPGSSRGTKTTPHTRKDSISKSVLFPLGEPPGSLDKPVESNMLENVPTKRQSGILYKGFMSGVHAISPVVHPPSILKKYKAFWNWYENSGESGEPCPDPSFIPLLYAIWYGGSVTISLWTIRDEFDVENRAALSTIFHDEVTRWLRRISFPRNPSIHGLKAFLLVQTILSREEEPLASSLFISLALRVAQTMGLHRDPAQFGISACQAEARRRIWWHIVHMDGVVAMSSGLPPLVSDENYWDVRITSEVKDTLLDTPEAAEYERMISNNERKPDCPSDPNMCPGSSMVNVYYLSAKGKYVMARILCCISTFFEKCKKQNMAGCSSVLIKASALRHCHGFMDKFILLATDPDFQPFQWSWPGIMLIDLYERPQTAEAPKSRAFIDKIFSLSGPDGGVVGGEDGISTSRPLRDGGREAWDMLRRLREKAWLKAGLDPSVLWTEQAQAEARRPTNKHIPMQIPKEGRGSTFRSLADGYFTPVKEPCDRNIPSNSQSVKPQRERERARAQNVRDNAHKEEKIIQERHPHTKLEANSVSSHDYATSTSPLPGTLFPWPAATSQPPQAGDTTKQLWSSPSKFSHSTINDASAYQFPSPPPATTTANPTTPPGTFNTPTPSTSHNTSSHDNNNAVNLPTFTSTEHPTAPNRPMPVSISTAPNINIDMQQNPNPNRNLPFQSSSPRSNNPLPDHLNLQFDWDQWDAVFGPSLPVVDDLMHLDSINTGMMGPVAGVGGNMGTSVIAGGGGGGGGGGGRGGGGESVLSGDESGAVLMDLGLAAEYYNGRGP
ncbi:C6 transcription factor [Histoplasma capsulatum]|uniref:C6 finger domain transcription factor nscR n=1 Tax=Ajellomyces capsulatus TaxID=5037 RepID=A0A8A1MEZ2_AJECA|nr:C6 transcription factor [Histoplasma capsulatum]